MTNKQKQVLGAAVAVCLLIAVAGFFFLIKPARQKVKDINAETASVQTENATLQTQIAQLQAQEVGLVDKQVELKRIGQHIPDNLDQSGLFRQMSDVASKSGVVLSGLTFSQASGASTSATGTTAKPSGATGATGVSAVASAPAAYSTVPVSMAVQGNYSQLVMFMDRLEHMQRLVLVKSLSLNPLVEGKPSTTQEYAPDGSVEQTGDLTINVSGEVYYTSPDTTSISLPALSGAGVSKTVTH